MTPPNTVDMTVPSRLSWDGKTGLWTVAQDWFLPDFLTLHGLRLTKRRGVVTFSLTCNGKPFVPLSDQGVALPAELFACALPKKGRAIYRKTNLLKRGDELKLIAHGGEIDWIVIEGWELALHPGA